MLCPRETFEEPASCAHCVGLLVVRMERSTVVVEDQVYRPPPAVAAVLSVIVTFDRDALPPAFITAARLLVRLLARTLHAYPEFYFRHMMAGVPPADRAALADPAFRSMLLESTVQALQQSGAGAVRELTLLARPWGFDLQRISVPVQLWQGLADNIVPPHMARYMEERLPHCECRYLPDEGHFSLIYKYHHDILAGLRRAAGE